MLRRWLRERLLDAGAWVTTVAFWGVTLAIDRRLVGCYPPARQTPNLAQTARPQAPIADLWPTCLTCGHLEVGVPCQICDCPNHVSQRSR